MVCTSFSWNARLRGVWPTGHGCIPPVARPSFGNLSGTGWQPIPLPGHLLCVCPLLSTLIVNHPTLVFALHCILLHFTRRSNMQTPANLLTEAKLLLSSSAEEDEPMFFIRSAQKFANNRRPFQSTTVHLNFYALASLAVKLSVSESVNQSYFFSDLQSVQSLRSLQSLKSRKSLKFHKSLQSPQSPQFQCEIFKDSSMYNTRSLSSTSNLSSTSSLYSFCDLYSLYILYSLHSLYKFY